MAVPCRELIIWCDDETTGRNGGRRQVRRNCEDSGRQRRWTHITSTHARGASIDLTSSIYLYLPSTPAAGCVWRKQCKGDASATFKDRQTIASSIKRLTSYVLPILSTDNAWQLNGSVPLPPPAAHPISLRARLMFGVSIGCWEILKALYYQSNMFQVLLKESEAILGSKRRARKGRSFAWLTETKEREKKLPLRGTYTRSGSRLSSRTRERKKTMICSSCV
jgi:hypothetical protein